jgi:hypothetical protein
MSRILRRPMFRGGPVDSYNTGIASGLGDEGYADGGRVGFDNGGLTPRPGFFSRVGSSARYYNPLTEAGISNIGRGIYNKLPGMGGNILRGTTALYPMLSTLAVPAATIGGMAYLNRPMNEAELRFMQENEEITSKETTDPNLYEGYFKGRAEARAAGEKAGQPKLGFFETIGKAKEISEKPKEPMEPKESELDKLKKYYADLMKEKELEYKKTIGELTKKPTEEEDITKQAKLYEKLLGGEEARSQSIYDALLAASPAFFKGKNLREAAPQVLESINKSGAFDKPRDIRQAAAQLAIQRRMLMDKASAEEKARLAILSAKNQPQSVTDQITDTAKNLNIPFSQAANLKGPEFFGDAYDGIAPINTKTQQLILDKMKEGKVYFLNNRYVTFKNGELTSAIPKI